jgi:hypothetical protein
MPEFTMVSEQLSVNSYQLLQDLRNWHIGRVRQISTICLFAGFMQLSVISYQQLAHW